MRVSNKLRENTMVSKIKIIFLPFRTTKKTRSQIFKEGKGNGEIKKRITISLTTHQIKGK